ncbi:MAG: tetratricopeptide repeat protein, partial [Rhodocyclaceae bacterium]|nr:tetratricopeptide repeat protein [Rhodocyclaceae bacterium]
MSETLAVDQSLRQAVAHHQAGQLQEAGELYRAILQTDPGHPEANHRMGMLAVQMEQPEAGLSYLMAALDADPARGQYWLSYIDALFQAGQLEAAREVLELARRQGLEGDAVDALAARMEGGAQAAVQVKAESQHVPEGTQPARPDESAGKSATHQANRPSQPSPQEIDTLVSLFTAGRYAEAASLAQNMTLRFPLHEFGWKMLGVVFKQMRRSAEALAPMQKAVAMSPGDAQAHCNLGVILQDMGRMNEAEASYRRALQVKPDFAEAHYNLSNTLKELGRLIEAEASCRRALQIKPDYADAHYILGNILHDQDQLDEAEVSLRRALEINPHFAEAHGNLGVILQAQNRLDEAEASYRRALQIKPDLATAHYNLSATLKDLGRFAEAEAGCRRVLAIIPEYAPAHQNLAAILAYLSDYDQVVAESDAALHLNPDDAVGWEQRLYAFSYHPDLTAEEIYGEFVRWGDRFPEPATDFSARDRTPGRRLRIGYVSPDFRRHTSRFFFWPLFANHDHAVVELYAYSNVRTEDDFTQKFKGLFEHWRNIRGVEDDEVA